MDEMRAGTTSTVAKFSGRGWPEARAISRRRSCCGDGFGLRSPCAIADAIKHPTMSARSTRKRGGQWNPRGWRDEAGAHRNRRREPADVRSSVEQLRGLAASRAGGRKGYGGGECVLYIGTEGRRLG
jgi:hypothetical protein